MKTIEDLEYELAEAQSIRDENQRTFTAAQEQLRRAGEKVWRIQDEIKKVGWMVNTIKEK